MLTPEYLAGLSDDIVLLYDELQNSIIEDMARRIVKTGQMTDTAKWQAEMLQNSGMLYDDIVNEIASTTKFSTEEVKRLFTEAQVRTMNFDNEIYEEAGLKPLEKMSPAALKVFYAGIRKTNGLVKNLTKTTANQAQQTYINACTLAESQVESGAFGYQQAIRNAVKTASTSGAYVRYPTGHKDRVDVAVRRAVLTGVGQTTGEISEENAIAMGCDLMEITAHAGARPSHAAWQGKLVSLSGKKGYLGKRDIGYGTGPGFKGWNCRHDWYPFFEGISHRAYSNQRLKELSEKKVVYNDEEIGYYEATQKQREMERQIRATRRELNGYTAAMEEADKSVKAEIQKDFDKTAIKLKRQEAAYKDFSYKTGLGPDPFRLQTTGFGKSISQKAVWANRKATYSAGKFGAIPVTQSPIYRVKYMKTSLWDMDQNITFETTRQQLLKEVMKYPVGTEVGAYVNINNARREGAFVIGRKNAVALPALDHDYVSLHSHPDGGIFSFDDLFAFIRHENEIAMCVVGNDGESYFIQKLSSFCADDFFFAVDNIKKSFTYNGHTIQTLSALDKNDQAKAYEALQATIETFLKEGNNYGIKYSRK